MSTIVLYGISIGGFAVLMFAVRWFSKRRKGKKDSEYGILGYIKQAIGKKEDAQQSTEESEGKDDKKEDTEAVKAIVHDNKTRTMYKEDIPGDTIKKIIATHGNLGRKWDSYGEPLYSLCKSADGAYSPVIPAISADTPNKLYRAQTHPHIPILWDLKIEANLIMKYGWFILLAGGVIFFLWTIIMK